VRDSVTENPSGSFLAFAVSERPIGSSIGRRSRNKISIILGNLAPFVRYFFGVSPDQGGMDVVGFEL
jgi:hypothetical protein